MSRSGKKPIPVPKGVEVKVNGNNVSVKGPKGTLSEDIKDGISVKVEDGNVIVAIDENADKGMAKFHGLYRSLINNMVIGTSTGFDRVLEMKGVGYRAAAKGNTLEIQAGFSHPTNLPLPEGVTVKVDKNTLITVSGSDKQRVGQFAASIRAIRPPEPYKGKGIHFQGEYVRRKAGKAGK